MLVRDQSRYTSARLKHVSPARATRTTICLVAGDHMVACFDVSHPFAHRLDNTRCFMPKHTREEAFRVLTRESVCVRVAQGRCNDLDTNFARSGRCNGHIRHF